MHHNPCEHEGLWGVDTWALCICSIYQGTRLVGYSLKRVREARRIKVNDIERQDRGGIVPCTGRPKSKARIRQHAIIGIDAVTLHEIVCLDGQVNQECNLACSSLAELSRRLDGRISERMQCSVTQYSL